MKETQKDIPGPAPYEQPSYPPGLVLSLAFVAVVLLIALWP